MLAEQGLRTLGVGSAEGLSLPFVGIPKALTGRISAKRAFAYCTPPDSADEGLRQGPRYDSRDLLLATFDIALDRCLFEQDVWLDKAVAAMPAALPHKAARVQGDSKSWRKSASTTTG
jgi:diacylglycerol O-acyltransferase / wax synthase